MKGTVVEREDLIGEISYFPLEVVQAMVEEQVRAGNKADVSVFQRKKMASEAQGGFTWVQTRHGIKFWNDVIANQKFSLFYKEYGPGCSSFSGSEEVVPLPLSFVKEAYAAACPEWKKKIEGHVPEIKPQEPYKVGDIFTVDGFTDQFILARIAYDTFNLISLQDGNRFLNGGFKNSGNSIERSVFEKFIGQKTYERIKRAGSLKA